MSIEEYTPDIDSADGLGTSADSASNQVSEKFKESVKKASAGIKRTKKDEKKARQHDMLLANFLVKIIINPKYDFILTELFALLNKGYSSNFVLGIMSVLYVEVSDKIRDLSGKDNIKFSYKSSETIEFNDSELPREVKFRINQWVEDMIDSVSVDYSSVLTKRLLELLKSDETIIHFIGLVFRFFLKEININISGSKSESIVSFILSEVYSSLEKLNIEEV